MLRTKLLAIKKNIDVLLLEDELPQASQDLIGGFQGTWTFDFKSNFRSSYQRFLNTCSAIGDAGQSILDSIKGAFTWHLESDTGEKFFDLVSKAIRNLRQLTQSAANAPVATLFFGFSISSAIIVAGLGIAYYIKSHKNILLEQMKDITSVISEVTNSIKSKFSALFEVQEDKSLLKKIFEFVVEVICAPFNLIYKIVNKPGDNVIKKHFSKIIIAICIGVACVVHMYKTS